MAGFDIPLGVDPAGFKKGMTEAGESADDLAKSLDQVAKGSDLSEIEDDLRGVSKEADKTSEALEDISKGTSKAEGEVAQDFEDMERSAQDAADAIGRSMDQAATSTSGSVQAGTRDVAGAMQEVKMEALQNANQAFASFDGSAKSFVDGIQGTFGGLIVTLGPLLGPAGLIAAMAGATGVGLISAAMGKAGQDSDAFKQKVKDLTGQYMDTGKVGKRSFSDIAEELKSMANETDDTKTNLGNLEGLAKTLKKPLSEVTAAYLEGGPALDTLIKKTREKQAADVEAATSQSRYSQNNRADLEREASNLDMVAGKLEKQQAAYKAAREAQILAIQAGADKYDVATTALDSIAQGYDDIRQSASDAATAQDGTFDINKYLQSVEDQKKVLAGFKSNLGQMKLTPDEWATFFSLDSTVQQNLAQSWVNGDQPLKDRIAGTLDDAGTTGGQQAAISYDEAMKAVTGKKRTQDVQVNVDDSALGRVERRLRDIGKGVLIPIGTTAGRFANGYV